MSPFIAPRSLVGTAILLATLAACDDKSAVGPQHATPVALSVTAGAAQSGAAGSALGTPLTVLVADAAGRPIPGVAVSWTVAGVGGQLLTSQAASDSTGHATATWALGTTVGADSLIASVSDGNTLINAVFVANAVAGPAAKIVVVSGGGQSATAGSPLAAPIVVQVTDQYGNPVAGALVTWAAAAGNLAAVTSVTDANGFATDALTLGMTAGPDPVTVTATSPAGPVGTIVPETAN